MQRHIEISIENRDAYEAYKKGKQFCNKNCKTNCNQHIITSLKALQKFCGSSSRIYNIFNVTFL
jgi:hypothetical protein